jgi:hypothetical protein
MPPSKLAVTPPATDVRFVVCYGGSPPATRALDAAVNLLQDRAGSIEVVYVAHTAEELCSVPGTWVTPA